ncbi:MAG: site-specific integrase [Clostridiales bacterium]|jgi:integrase|nr:site-specific integrase [Clostridiales bacterium]
MENKKKGIYRRGDGRYEARFAAGNKGDGSKRYRSVYGKTQAEAGEKMRAALKDMESVRPVRPKTVSETLRAYMKARENSSKLSTQATYRGYLEQHIEPLLGTVRCDRLTLQHAQGFVDALLDRGLSVGAARSIFSFMKTGLEYACPQEALDVVFPKYRKADVKFLSAQEQQLLETAARESGADDYVSTLLCLYTALRIGEMCGLKWEDVDFETGMLYIRRTVQRIRVAKPEPGAPRTQLVFLAPKTESSVRSIPLPSALVSLLRKHRSEARSMFIVSCNGDPLEPRTLQNRFKKLLAKAGIRDVNFHAMRHTFVVRALENEVDIKTISEVMGHASPVVTMKRYAHSHEDHKRKKLEAMAKNIE